MGNEGRDASRKESLDHGDVVDSPQGSEPKWRIEEIRDHITSVMETIRPPRAWMYFIWLLMSLPDTR